MPTMFKSFFLGGFECSTHGRPDGQRLDLLAATGHDQRPHSDYLQLQAVGVSSVRDGIRWHLIEPEADRYDWSSFLPMLHAADETGTQVVWDLCHYGWPDGLTFRPMTLSYTSPPSQRPWPSWCGPNSISTPFFVP